ncbi:protein-export membrane protein SecD [Aggregatibacter actinomycetemcomitans serotype e str. SC1083]|uniref:Protein translocase subunit SecD n=1 Tax=Aggregatibacter actinomycetemcomitans serotype e str. SC1083 TaxID=907488 RepID=G4A959_AGGAC|nr:protein translocase subunit SecD [Aggregatibacter actinomycetemcomitans]EGY33639.1 protein-export membrane protein SecD [Aggregatibacter actinomycetemcomitans serotype e str. SC1083]KYK72419.1 preprotein translocase subunit SecD [Aggregatibacter actinomycetemcomitans serotype e str. SA3096]KYK81644.1 preprotein translocase subunit SecD [Aggregatibacter actinomycetemcomitans serotype e str. SC936]KYK94705.1 preprotein translocase subunit SecD [Aggregatibacter actinomycetemcomitans serotype e 
MLNRYPLWKNLMVIFVVAIGILYALPNLYGEDPAVQISGTRGQEANSAVLSDVQSVLKDNNLATKSIVLENGSILVRFNNTDTQLLAKDKITEKLGTNYSVALNLAPATPKWLSSIGGNPMKWGLDLRGGVRFLMEVDMNSALTKRQEQLQDSLRTELRKEKYQYSAIKSIDNFSTGITLANPEQLSDVQRYLHRQHPNLDVRTTSDNTLSLGLSDSVLNEARESAIEQNLSILRKRVTELGVAEAVIQRQGAERIVVELPGVQDTARAKEILGATATLEFRIVNTNANLEAAARGMVPSDSEVKYDRNNRPVVLYKRAVLGGEHITNASSGVDQNTSLPQVSVTLDSEGGEIMSQTTRLNLKKPMATLYVEYKDSGKKDENGKTILQKHEEVINVATIQGRFGSQFQITGIDSPAEAQNLAVLLRSGALIAPIQIVEERTIGPSLGAQNVEQGLQASFWGLMIVVAFMVIYYRKFGIIASIALIANIVLLVGLMSLLPGATLTMPGIAGIVLAVGMSVDANVLIFERIKEEIRNGRPIQQAINEGYSGAFSSIFDANLTTILTAVALYAVGTGPIKGFAITLSLGIAISMFTAITGTRAIVNFLYGGKRIGKLSI